MMEVDDLWFWVVDGSSIEYLDLRTCEFQREKIPRLISSLDLSLPPTPPTAPYVPLIPVFETTSGRMSVIFPNWTATVFFDFSRNILQNLELNWEEDIAKLYVSHLRAFCHYVETCFYSANCFRTTSISSPQSKRKTLPRYKTELINSLKLEATWKLVRNLFGNVRLDSGVIMDILDPICSWKKLAQISLKSDPAIADSILSHLRRNQRWVTTEELMKFFSSDKLGTIRKRPKNLLVFLNHGFKNLCNPTYLFLNRMIFEMRAANPHFWNIRGKILDCFRREMPMEKREAMILEMCAIFLCCGDRNLCNYIESMSYIWRSIPDVYITLEEIKHTLFKFLDIENDEFVEEICHELRRRGFNGFEDKQETNSAENAQREEPKSKIEDLRSAKSLLSEEYDSPDDRLSMDNSFQEEDRYSHDSKLQLPEEKFCLNSRVSKNPESLTSLPRGLFLPYTFRDPHIFLEFVNAKLLRLTRIAKSLINDDNSTIQPHTPFAHNLGTAEEVLAGTSQSSEESGDPIHETRNLFEYSREAVRNSVTQNPQRARDSIRPKKEMSEDLIREPENTFQYSLEAAKHSKTENTQWARDSIPHNLDSTEVLPSTSQGSGEPQDCNRGHPVQYSQKAVRHSVTQNPHRTRDSIHPKKEMPAVLIREPENTFQYSREAVRHCKTEISQWTRGSMPHNLGSAEVFASSSQSLEEPYDPIRGQRNPLQYSREAVRHSVTENTQWLRGSISPNNKMPEDLIREPGNTLQYSRGSFRGFLARNSQRIGDSVSQTGEDVTGKIRSTSNPSSKLVKERDNQINLPGLLDDSINAQARDSNFQLSDEEFRITPPQKTQFNYSQEAMRYGATSSSYLPERTVDQPNTNSPFSQVPEIPEIPISQPRNLSETLAVGAPTDDLPNRVPRILNPLFPVKKKMHSLRSIIRELLNRNPQWTEDSDLQARQQQRDNNNEDKTTNTSISSSKLPKEHGNFMNLPNLSPDSRSARSRNKRDSNFRLPDEGIRMNPPKRIKFSYSQEPMRYGAIYDPNFPEEIEYHQIKNDLLSQAPGNSEILVSRTRNIAESRIRTVMARILTIPDRLFVQTFKFENTIRDLLIRHLKWTESFAAPYIKNLQMREEPGNSGIQMSSIFTCTPGGMEGLPNNNPPFPLNFYSLANFMSRVLGAASGGLIHTSQNRSQRTDDSLDRQTRDSQYLEVPDPTGPQPRRLLHYSRCVIRDALILNLQLPQGITLLKLPDRLQSYLKLEL